MFEPLLVVLNMHIELGAGYRPSLQSSWFPKFIPSLFWWKDFHRSYSIRDYFRLKLELCLADLELMITQPVLQWLQWEGTFTASILCGPAQSTYSHINQHARCLQERTMRLQSWQSKPKRKDHEKKRLMFTQPGWSRYGACKCKFNLVWITKAFNLEWLLNLWERGNPQNNPSKKKGCNATGKC